MTRGMSHIRGVRLYSRVRILHDSRSRSMCIGMVSRAVTPFFEGYSYGKWISRLTKRKSKMTKMLVGDIPVYNCKCCDRRKNNTRKYNDVQTRIRQIVERTSGV